MSTPAPSPVGLLHAQKHYAHLSPINRQITEEVSVKSHYQQPVPRALSYVFLLLPFTKAHCHCLQERKHAGQGRHVPHFLRLHQWQAWKTYHEVYENK